MRGFRFVVDPTARASEKRMLLAAAERRLGAHLNEMAQALLAVDDKAFALASPPAGEVQIVWNGHAVATLKGAQRLLAPEVVLDSGLSALAPEIQQGIAERFGVWVKGQLERHVPALIKMDEGSQDPEIPAPVRAVLAQLADAGGIMPRANLDEALSQVAKEDRAHLRKAGVVIGVMDLYHPGLMKPGAAQWRMALLALKRAKPLVTLPQAGVVLIGPNEDGTLPVDEIGARIAGFRKLDNSLLRIDMAERLARGAHEAIAAGKPYAATDPTIVSIGLSEAAFLDLMRQAGFRPVPEAAEDAPNWQFRGRPKPRPKPERGPRRGPRPDRAQQGAAKPDGAQQDRSKFGNRSGGKPRDKAAGEGANAGDRQPRPERGPRPQHGGGPRDRDRDRPRQAPLVATGKGLAGLAALFGKDE
jgi:ATP-dependent RNA helicase SUPV3L1/SUV3